MISKLFTGCFAPQNLTFVAVGCALPRYLPKTKIDILSDVFFILPYSIPAPFCSLGAGFHLYQIINLTGQIPRALSKADQFILLCKAFMAGKYAYNYFQALSEAKEEPQKSSSNQKSPQPTNFSLRAKQIAIIIQLVFQPSITLAGFVAGGAFLHYYELVGRNSAKWKRTYPDLQIYVVKAETVLKELVDRTLETEKTSIVWNEWNLVATSVASAEGAFFAGVEQALELRNLLGKKRRSFPKDM